MSKEVINEARTSSSPLTGLEALDSDNTPVIIYVR